MVLPGKILRQHCHYNFVFHDLIGSWCCHDNWAGETGTEFQWKRCKHWCVCVCVCAYTQTSHHVYLWCRKPWTFQSSPSASPSSLVKISFRALNQLEGGFGGWFFVWLLTTQLKLETEKRYLPGFLLTWNEAKTPTGCCPFKSTLGLTYLTSLCNSRISHRQSLKGPQMSSL